MGTFRATGIPVLDIHELAAGKLAALMSRGTPRDVFDSCELLRGCELDQVQLRLAFVVYGGANRRDWRSVSTDDVRLDPTALSRELLPMLRVVDRADPTALAGKLTEECRERLGIVLPLRSAEREFITALNERGEIASDLLTSDAQLQSAIGGNPALLWKAANVREHGCGAPRLSFPSWVDRGRSR